MKTPRFIALLLPFLLVACASGQGTFNTITVGTVTFEGGSGATMHGSSGAITITPLSGDSVILAGNTTISGNITFGTTPSAISSNGPMTISTVNASTLALTSTNFDVAISGDNGVEINTGSGSLAITGPVSFSSNIGSQLRFVSGSSITEASSFLTFAAAGGRQIAFTGGINGTGGIAGAIGSSSAPSGDIGEYFTISRADTTTALTNATATNALGTTAATLGSGDWDVGGAIWLDTTGATVTQIVAVIGPTSGNTSSPAEGTLAIPMTLSGSTNHIKIPIPTYQVKGTGSSLFLNVAVQFSAGSVSAGGTVWARRSANAK